MEWITTHYSVPIYTWIMIALFMAYNIVRSFTHRSVSKSQIDN